MPPAEPRPGDRTDRRDPSDASYLRMLLLGIAAFICAGLVIAAIIVGVVAIVD